MSQQCPAGRTEALATAVLGGTYKAPSSQSYSFSSSHVWMWELDSKKGRAPKNWCLRTVVLEKTLESPLDSKEIKPVHPRGNQPWIFIRRTDAEAEAPILWPPDAEAGGEGGDRGWHLWLNGDEFEPTPGDAGVLQSMRSQRVSHDWATERWPLGGNWS